MTFLHPLFLWAALVISVPLVLHFMLRRKVKTIHFSTLRLLGLLSRKSSSNLRFNQWLLLLIRICIVVFIVFLFAQPLFDGVLSLLNGSPGKVIFLVDNSHSMSLRKAGEKSVYENVLSKVEKAVSTLDPRTEVTMVTLAPVAKVIASAKAAAFDISSLIKPVYAAPDLKGALLITEELSSSVSASDSAVKIYSDFQNSPWSHYLEKLAKLSLPVTLVPVFSDSYANWAISAVSFPEGKIVSNRFVLLQVSLTWAGRELKPSAGQLTVKDTDGQLLASQIIAAPEGLSPFGTMTVELPLRFLKEGVNRFTIHIESDNDCLKADNSLDYAVDVIGERIVMLFNGAPRLQSENDELFYLRHVYSGFKGPVTISEYDKDAIPSLPEMKRAEVIHLASFSVDSESLAANLLNCVLDGCVLVNWAGENLDIPALNRHLMAKFSSYEATEVVGNVSRWYSGKSTISEPGIVFSDAYIQELATTSYLLLKKTFSDASVSGDRKEAILAHYDDGTPAVMARKMGKGAFVFVNASADIDWSNLPLHPVFPAFAASLQDLGRNGIDTISCGEVYISAVSAQGGRLAIGELVTPDGSKAFVTPVLYDGRLAYACTNTWQPGLYSFSSEKEGGQVAEYFMVMPLAADHSLQRIEVSLLDKGGLTVDLAENSSIPGKSAENSFGGVHSTDLLLLLLSLFLALEAFVVWRIGKTVLPEQGE